MHDAVVQFGVLGVGAGLGVGADDVLAGYFGQVVQQRALGVGWGAQHDGQVGLVPLFGLQQGRHAGGSFAGFGQ